MSLLRNRFVKLFFILLGIGIIFILLIPIPNASPSFSKALYSKEGKLLSASVSKEEQWCFPLQRDIPQKFVDCVVLYEDEYFYYHLGVNPISIAKTILLNYKKGKIVRGASTITMQLMRMKNKNVERNVKNKIWESLSAIKYSLLHSKKETLKKWCEITPYGSNIVGIRAASLHYFGREIENLSWGEYALLAVIPNSPTYANIVHNRDKLIEKRNFLLRKLYEKKYFPKDELTLYLDEDIPEKFKTIEQKSYHLLSYCKKKYPELNIYNSTIDASIQNKLNAIVNKEAEFLQMDDINNIAVMIIDISSNELVGYLGNINSKKGKFNYVDIPHSQRSYGSLLKPFLYLYAVENGYLLPHELIADIPTNIGDYRPENFDKKYRGVLPFQDMVIKSLNIPAVRTLNRVGLQGFYNEIKELKINDINKGADHYGLSLILGGGEATLWDLCKSYKGLARNYTGLKNPFGAIKFLQDQKIEPNTKSYGKQSLYYTIEAMADLERPREEKYWNLIDKNNKIAWKTGTSYGHRDAWAIGFNNKYLVGVWVGNANGEGRYNLTGVSKAAPVMFKVFNSLSGNAWFDNPLHSHKTVTVCAESGKLKSKLCTQTEPLPVSKNSHKYVQCDNHKVIKLNQKGKIIPPNCDDKVFDIDTIFSLPAYMAYYYYKDNPNEKNNYEVSDSCDVVKNDIQVIYPYDRLKIFLPKDDISKQNKIIAKAYHSNESEPIFWYLDHQFVTKTQSGKHEAILFAGGGKHQLKIIDTKGNSQSVVFEIIGREGN